MPDPRWRVVLVEDDADMLAYFAQCTRASSQLALSGAFATLSAARQWLAEHEADVLLTDLALPDGHGIELIRWLHARQPACDILVVSVFGDEETVLACIEAGAVGYVHKDSKPADVAQTILDVKRGASPISPMIARKLLLRLRRPEPAAPPAQASKGAVPQPAPARSEQEPVTLSPRESEVLELIARGYSYAEIARLHQVTLHTVQSHIRSLYGKLAVHSRSEAVFEASRLGLISSLGPREPRR